MFPDAKYCKIMLKDGTEIDVYYSAHRIGAVYALARRCARKNATTINCILVGRDAPYPYDDEFIPTQAYDENGKESDVVLLAQTIERGMKSRNLLTVAVTAATINQIMKETK